MRRVLQLLRRGIALLFYGGGYLLASLLALVFVAGMISVILLWSLNFFRPLSLLPLTDEREMSVIYDEREEKIREYCTYCREIFGLEEMGEIPRFAVAIEDRRFWTRPIAIDLRGMIRAAWNDLKEIRTGQGGSTISQQVAQIFFLQEDLVKERAYPSQRWRKWLRKAKQVWYAARLEGRIDRGQILEHYLNNAFLGHGRYGVKSASMFYFGKEPKILNKAEAALLAGLLHTPPSSPFIEKEKAKAVRARVLDQLASEGIITREEEKDLNGYPLPEKQEPDSCNAFHAAEFAWLQITDIMHFADRGVKAYLTINCDWNRTAASSLQKAINAMQARNPALTDLRAAAITIDRRTGAIKVFTQAPSFAESQHRADQMRRHAGSAAKPYAILAYLLAGGKLSAKDEGSGVDKLNDSPGLTIFVNRDVGLKHIQNFPYVGLHRYINYADPILCLAESRNACIMSMVQGVNGGRGIVSKDDITELIVRLGITLPEISKEEARSVGMLGKDLAERLGVSRLHLDPGKTVAIGSIGITPYEMIRSLTGFFNEYVDLRIINQIVTKEGDAPAFPDAEPKPILETFWENAAIRATIKKEVARREDEERRRIAKENPPKNGNLKKIEIPRAIRERIRKEVKEHAAASLASMTDTERAKQKEEAQREAKKLSLALIRGLRAPVEFEHGTAKLARTGDEDLGIPKLDFQIMGKTGTSTNDQGETNNNWFWGCDPSYCTVVLIGRKDERLPMKTIGPDGKEIQETGGKNTLPPFIEIMKKIHETVPLEKFPDATDPKVPFQFSVSEKLVFPPEDSTPPKHDDF